MKSATLKSNGGLLKSMCERVTKNHQVIRQKYPSMFSDPDRLTIDQLANLLCCSVDQARRIPRSELPAYRGPGKYLLYLRQDALRYIQSRPSIGRQVDEGSERRAALKGYTGEGVVLFDPDKAVKSL